MGKALAQSLSYILPFSMLHQSTCMLLPVHCKWELTLSSMCFRSAKLGSVSADRSTRFAGPV